MSTTTTNYGLIKPDTTDPILIGQLNDNSDAIDAALKENADAIENKPDAADIPTPSTAAPAMDGTAAAGTSTNYARADHVHPSDTSKQDALTTAQLAAANSGIDSTKVEQIETNKNNILWNTQNGVKNIAKPNTISATSGITVVQNLGHYEISGTTGGSQYTAYLCTPTEDIIATEELYITAATTRTNVNYMCHWKNTQDESRFSIIGTGLTIPQGCKIHTIYIQVATNTTFSLNADMMICKKAIYDADPSYQPYAMSNVELTQNITSIINSLAACRFLVDTADKATYSFTFPKPHSTTNRYRFGLIIAGVSAAETSLFAIFADTNNNVTINKIAGTTSRTFTGTISYSGDNCTLTITPNDTQYGGIRVIWFD